MVTFVQQMGSWLPNWLDSMIQLEMHDLTQSTYSMVDLMAMDVVDYCCYDGCAVVVAAVAERPKLIELIVVD